MLVQLFLGRHQLRNLPLQLRDQPHQLVALRGREVFGLTHSQSIKTCSVPHNPPTDADPANQLLGAPGKNSFTGRAYVFDPTVNTAPVAKGDTYGVSEGATLNVPSASGVLANDTDAESNPLTALLVAKPANGTVALGSDGSFKYIHNGSETTSDKFTYRANDGKVNSNNVATVTISVTPVNDPPVASGDSYTVTEGATLAATALGTLSASPAAKGVLANDTDPEGDTLTAVLVDKPANGTVTLNANGTFSYIHNGSETTKDSFTYKGNDGKADSNVATVSISVTPVNDPPVAKNDGYSVGNGQSLQVSAASGVLANDTDAETDPLTAALVSNPTNGTVV